MSEKSPLTSVADDEPLTRFIFTDRYYNEKQGRVKPGAFVPRPHIETSVNRLEKPNRLSDVEIWSIGDKVGEIRNKKLLARADLPTSNVRYIYDKNGENIGLEVEPDPRPIDDPFENPNHAIIVNWPVVANWEIESIEKNKYMLAATLMAEASNLKMR